LAAAAIHDDSARPALDCFAPLAMTANGKIEKAHDSLVRRTIVQKIACAHSMRMTN